MNITELEEKINRCRLMSLDEVNLEDVDDIRDIKVDKRKSSNERMLDFLTKVKNPYIFKVNGRLVKFTFSNTDRTAEDCLTSVLKNLYR